MEINHKSMQRKEPQYELQPTNALLFYYVNRLKVSISEWSVVLRYCNYNLKQ